MFASFASLESAVIYGVLRVLLIIELTTDLGKSFPQANLLMMLISDRNFSVDQIREVRVTRLLIHGVRYVRDTRLVKLTYRPVIVYFRKTVIPSDDNSRCKKLGTSFWNISTAKTKSSNLLRALCT